MQSIALGNYLESKEKKTKKFFWFIFKSIKNGQISKFIKASKAKRKVSVLRPFFSYYRKLTLIDELLQNAFRTFKKIENLPIQFSDCFIIPRPLSLLRLLCKLAMDWKAVKRRIQLAPTTTTFFMILSLARRLVCTPLADSLASSSFSRDFLDLFWTAASLSMASNFPGVTDIF